MSDLAFYGTVPDFAELDRIEDELLEAVNTARDRFRRGEFELQEYFEALKTFNRFAASKPIRPGMKLKGLHEEDYVTSHS